MNSFVNHGESCFHITFGNEVTVSIAWGTTNYSDGGKRCAETCVYAGDITIIHKDNEVQSYQTPEDVAETLAWAAQL